MAWTNAAPQGNIQPMATELEKDSESLTFRCTKSDIKALEALMAEHFPMNKNRSLILRAVFRLGVPRLAEDPDQLTKAPTPKPHELTAAFFAARSAGQDAQSKSESRAETQDWIKTGRKGPPKGGK